MPFSSNDDPYYVFLIYECLGAFCHNCGIIGHLVKDCPTRQHDMPYSPETKYKYSSRAKLQSPAFRPSDLDSHSDRNNKNNDKSPLLVPQIRLIRTLRLWLFTLEFPVALHRNPNPNPSLTIPPKYQKTPYQCYRT